MVKAMNFDTLASGVTTPLVPSGFVMFDIDEFNPLQPVPPDARPRLDGGTYLNGVRVSGANPSFIYNGGTYLNGSLTPPLSESLINGGTY